MKAFEYCPWNSVDMYKLWSVIFPDREIMQEKEIKSTQTMEPLSVL